MGTRCCGVSLFLGVLFFLNCSLSEPEAPSWDATLNFPVGQKNYLMTDLIKDYEKIFEYKDGLLGFKAQGDLGKTHVGSNFSLDDQKDSIDIVVSDFIISRIDVGEITFSSSEIFSGLPQFDQEGVIAPFPIDEISGHVVSDLNVISVVAARGTARLTFTNQFPVALEITKIELRSQSGQLFPLYTEPVTINAKSTAQLDVDISGIEITNQFLWTVSGSSPGSRGNSVVIRSEDSLDLTIELINLNIERITTKGDGFQFAKPDSVQFGQAVCIRNATFKNGIMMVAIENYWALDLEVDLQCVQFRKRITNEPLQLHINVPPHRTVRREILIKDYEIAYEGELASPQCVQLFVNAKAFRQDGRNISLSGKDSIKLTFGMIDVVIDEFKGRLQEYIVGIKPIIKDVDIPKSLKNFHGFNLDDARLTLDFFNAIEMPIQIQGSLVGFADNGKQASLSIHGDLPAGQIGDESAKKLVYEASEDESVLSLVGLPPAQVQFSGRTVIGQGRTEGSITSQSYLRAQYTFETPAHLAWKETEFVLDTAYFQINPEHYDGEKLRQDVIVLSAKDVNQLESFQIIADIDNHLPVSGVIEFYVIDETSTSTESTVWLSPVPVESATLDISGHIEESWKHHLSLKMSKEDISIFNNYTDDPKLLKLVTKIKMHSTNGEKVKLYQDDYLAIQAFAELVIAIQKN